MRKEKKIDEHNDDVDDDAGGVDADAASDSDGFFLSRGDHIFLMNVKLYRAASYLRHGNYILCMNTCDASGSKIVCSNHATFLDGTKAGGVGPNLLA